MGERAHGAQVHLTDVFVIFRTDAEAWLGFNPGAGVSLPGEALANAACERGAGLQSDAPLLALHHLLCEPSHVSDASALAMLISWQHLRADGPPRVVCPRTSAHRFCAYVAICRGHDAQDKDGTFAYL